MAFLILTLVGYLLVQMVLPQLTESIKTVTMNLPTYYTNAESWLRQIFHDNIQLKGYVDQIVAEVYSQLTVWLRKNCRPRFRRWWSLLSALVSWCFGRCSTC